MSLIRKSRKSNESNNNLIHSVKKETNTQVLISFCFASFIFESRITVLYHSTIESGTWVVSQSTRGILSRTFKHFGIEPEYVGCFNLFHRKPHIRNLQKALEKLGLQTDTIDHPMELIKYLQ